MFKKRTPALKKLDLHQQAENITLVPNPNLNSPEQPANLQSQELRSQIISRTPIGRPKPKANSITLEVMESNQIREEKQSKRQYVEIGQEEITDCLNEIRQLKANESITEEENEIQPQITETRIVQQLNGNCYDSEEYDDNELLEVQQDFQGGFSPQRENDPYHEDYEEELIRRTLTKHNYDRLKMRGGPHLSDLKALQSRDKVFDKIEKVSSKRIKNTIKRDLQTKRRIHEELVEGIRLKKGGIQRQGKEVQKKQRRLAELRTQLQRVNKVIEYLYYYGDRVQAFEMGAILRQIEQKNNEPFSYNFEDVE